MISFDSTDPDEVKRVEAAVEEIFKTAVELGGSLTSEEPKRMARPWHRDESAKKEEPYMIYSILELG